MKTKRFLALLLAVLMLATLLAGCGEPSAPAATEAPKAESAPQATEAPAAPAVDEYTLPREDGTRQLTLYWTHPSGSYDKCDVWVWFPGRDGHGELFHECPYGAKVVINVPADVSEVGFIVRRDCSDPGGSSWGEATKDYDQDRFAVLTGDETVIYLKSGDKMQYTSTDGGKTLSAIRLFTMAGIQSPTEIQYFISPAKRIASLDEIRVLCGGESVAIASLSSLNNEVVTGVITLAEPLDLSKSYTVELDGYGSAPAVPTGLFDSEAFIRDYTYDGDDLGAVIDGEKTVFKVWAPTASDVTLNLFAAGDGGDAYDKIPMTLGEKGVWSAEAACGHGTYYTYSVTTSVGTQEAVDPYARAAGVNGNRGMVIDLAQTDPHGFRESEYYQGIDSYTEAIIWEVHVRDFSNTIEGSMYRGKYLAFTETGLQNRSGASVGLDYLKDLGITHVHLQPVYDYATVDESSDQAQFNWGYDPKNYNVPEGSYSTDPFHGEVRVNEFKQMVQSLHDSDIGVVMDVVYNHTYSLDSNLNRIVPYYYYRFTSDGAASNGSGCGNETASDRVMFRKYMVDSVVYWAEEYKVDGFRFDLMALHDVETMQAIEAAVHAVNPKAIIYGEGWTGGTSALAAGKQASQANIRQIKASQGAIGGVAVFNDAIRDGLKGSVFDSKDAGYINGKLSKLTGTKVIFGLQGGVSSAGASWSVDKAMVINYMSAHDNNTLWDKLLLTNPDASDEERLAMNRFGAAIVMISRGTPFFLAGEEMLRTKDGDSNSYASSDAVNNIDWSVLSPDSDAYLMVEYYKALIALRKANAFLTGGEVKAELLDDFSIFVTYTIHGTPQAYAVINPTGEAISYELPAGSYTVLLNGDEVFPEGGESVSGTVAVPAQGVLLVRK